MMAAASMMMMMIGSMVVSSLGAAPGARNGVAMAFSSGEFFTRSGRGSAPSQASRHEQEGQHQRRRRWRRQRALFMSPSSSTKSEMSLESSGSNSFMRATPSEEERPVYPKSRRVESAAVAAASASMSQRPGAIIETEEQLAAKARILKEMDDGTVQYKNSEWLQEVFGEVMVVLDDEEEVDDDDTAKMDIMVGGEDGDDDQLLDANTLGTWTIEDIRSKFDYEWDPNGKDPDPNLVSLNQPAVRYVEEAPMDPHNDGVELGYDPIFGPSSPIDKRTILGAKDSYMVDPATRDEKRLQPQFARNDPELHFNQEVVEFRQAMDIMETFVRSKC
jgi:hypothetical protein